MSPRQRLVILPLVAVSLALSSCSGSDDAADPADTASTSDAVSTTVADASPPESTEPPVTAADTSVGSTDPPTTEAATTTDAPTTVVESTTTVPSIAPSTPEEEVTAAIEFFAQQWKECLRTLPTCDLDAVSERTRGDLNAETLSTATAFNSNDYRAENIDDLDYRVDDLVIDASATQATASVCVTDPVAILSADGTPVDDRFVTSTQEFDLEFDGDVWEWVARRTVGEVGETEAENRCT